jgi:hypothetical protein
MFRRIKMPLRTANIPEHDGEGQVVSDMPGKFG